MESLPPKHSARIKKIGQQVKEFRLKAGYTSYETFAFDHEIPRVQYGRLERGVNFKIATLMRILDIHKVSLEDFFKGLK